MEIKFTLQGLLIYIAMSGYLSAFFAMVIGHARSGKLLYLLGFIAIFSALIYRWVHVGHVPMQNLFEVFLCMGFLIYPLSIFCRWVLHVGAETADTLIGAIILFPAGFIFSAEPQHLPPALQSWLFAPHVAVYMASYILMAKATVTAFAEIFVKNKSHNDQKPNKDGLTNYETSTYRMICFGFPLMTLGLILGSVWGKLAWGDFWGWDPKELWSLATWLIYLCYFHFRYMYGGRFPKINSLLAILGMIAVVITLLWVNLAEIFVGLHSYAT